MRELESKYEEKKDFLSTKEDIGQLRKESAEARADLLPGYFERDASVSEKQLCLSNK